MKNLCKIILGLVAVVVVFYFLAQNEKPDYIRIHIKSNSETTIDRSIKLDIKDTVNSYLAEKLIGANDKEDGIQIINDNIEEITLRCNRLLREHGLNYSANVSLKSEYCPSRKYSNTTVESGYYDSLYIELGAGEGDNWWCVMYPPLCYEKNQSEVKFTSRIKDWISSIFN